MYIDEWNSFYTQNIIIIMAQIAVSLYFSRIQRRLTKAVA